DAADALGDLRPEIGFERWCARGERAEQNAGKALDAERADVVIGGIERRGHAAPAADAAAGGGPGPPALEVRRPDVVDAPGLAAVTGAVEAKERAAMGAAILEGAEAAVPVACDNDRHVADEGRAVIAGIGNLDLEAEEIPGCAHEELLALADIEFGVAIERVG